MTIPKQNKLFTSLRIIIPLWAMFALLVISVFFILVPSLEKNIIDQKKEMLRNLTDTNWSLLSEYNQRVKQGELTFEVAQSKAIKRVRHLRYGHEGKDYFWINDMHPRMVMHPYFPNLEGEDLTNFIDPNGKQLFMEFIKAVNIQGSGFVDYMWQWKDDPKKIVPKISYVRAFEPWGWIIGTGIYIEDVRCEIKLIVQDLIKIFLGILIIILGLSSYITWQAIKIEEKRSQAEDALLGSHKRFLTVLNSIDATIYVADMETYEIIFINKHMIKVFGSDMTGKICWQVFRGEDGPCPHCPNDKLLDENNRPTGVHTWQSKNPIAKKWYLNYDRVIEWTDGHLVKLQIATDITYLKEIEEKLRQAHKMESIGTLAGGIAHDFNNILFPIIGHTEMLLEDIPEDSPFRGNLDKIYASTLRAKDLVKQILTFSRQETSKSKLITIQPIIKEALKLIRSSIPTTIDIKQNIEADCGMIKANPTQIHQIVMNLTTNAYHAMEETGGELEVNLKEVEINKYSVITLDMTPGLYAFLSITDTGTGMDKDISAKIFDPFFTTK